MKLVVSFILPIAVSDRLAVADAFSLRMSVSSLPQPFRRFALSHRTGAGGWERSFRGDCGSVWLLHSSRGYWLFVSVLLLLVMLVLHTACIGAARLRYCSYWILLGLLVLMWLILHLHLVLYRWLLLGLILLPLLLLGFYAALKLLISGLFLRRLLLIWLLLQIATARIVLAKRTPKLNMPMRIYQMEDCIQFTTERMLSLSGRRWEFFCSFSCQLKLYFPPHPA